MSFGSRPIAGSRSSFVGRSRRLLGGRSRGLVVGRSLVARSLAARIHGLVVAHSLAGHRPVVARSLVLGVGRRPAGNMVSAGNLGYTCLIFLFLCEIKIILR